MSVSAPSSCPSSRARFPRYSRARCVSASATASQRRTRLGKRRHDSLPSTRSLVRGGVVDYYAVLNVSQTAPLSEVKRAYKELAREWHPDVRTRSRSVLIDAADDGEAERERFAVLLNEAYNTLRDVHKRKALDVLLEAVDDDEDEDEGFSGEAMSRWDGKACVSATDASRAVFVNEAACIGCRLCASVAAETFVIESEHGRARAVSQWRDEKNAIQDAVDSCPVDCIFWVPREQLPFLEHVMQRLPRPGVHTMRDFSARVPCPFNAAEDMKRRREVRQSSRSASRDCPLFLHPHPCSLFSCLSHFDFPGLGLPPASGGEGVMRSPCVCVCVRIVCVEDAHTPRRRRESARCSRLDREVRPHAPRAKSGTL